MTAITISSSMDLIFSQDDKDREGKGWYFHQYGNEKTEKTSVLYFSERVALTAHELDAIEWDEN